MTNCNYNMRQVYVEVHRHRGKRNTAISREKYPIYACSVSKYYSRSWKLSPVVFFF